MKIKKDISLTRSEFAENFLFLNGRALSLDDYPHLRRIYNDNSDELILKFSRQTAKSTTLANMMVANSAMIPFFKTLYIAPTVDQTKVFSHDRVNPVLEGSPILKEYYMNTSLIQNVFMKQFLNGSRMYLRYALLNADRIRGYSADMNLFDETQDLKADIIPVVHETMTRSTHKKVLYAGTPKRSRGTLADLWFRSTQNEYMVQCSKCNKWNLLDEDSIGPIGIICKKCGKDLDIAQSKGEWVSTFGHVSNKPSMEGFRVCLLHFAKAPWVKWHKDIIEKRENVSKGLFYNETLGLEYDSGVSPVTNVELQAACDPEITLKEEPDGLVQSYQAVMGIDYGPINSTESNTVISVVQLRGANEYKVVYMKKFLGKEADYGYIHDEIPKLMEKWNCVQLAADYGMGEGPNSEIRKRIGFQKVIAYQHMPSQKEKLRWNSKMPAYTLSRNTVMTDIFSKIKAGHLRFPKYQDSEPFLQDILNIQCDYNEQLGRMKYVNVGPDDFFHATLYAVLASELLFANGGIS